MMMMVGITQNTAQVEMICGSDGRWVVTTHNRRIVKIQWVVEEIDEGNISGVDIRQHDYLKEKYAGSLLPAADVGELITEADTGFVDQASSVRVERAIAQSEVLDRMFKTNSQWLVSVAGGQIVSACQIGKPEVIPEPEKPEPEPKRRSRTKTKVEVYPSS